MSDTLLPCPFCDGAATVFSSDGLYGINCANEDCACGTPMMPTYELAAEIWNHRAPAIPPDVRETLRGALLIVDQSGINKKRILAALSWLDAQQGGRNG